MPGSDLDIGPHLRDRAVLGFGTRKDDGGDGSVFVDLEQADLRFGVACGAGRGAGQGEILRIAEIQFLQFDRSEGISRPLVVVAAGRQKHGDDGQSENRFFH